MANSLKILFNGNRSAYRDFSNELLPTEVEPSTFSKIYLIVAISKASSYSEGFVRKQLEKLISDRMSLKEVNTVFRTHRTPKRAFVTTLEYWNIRDQQRAQAQWDIDAADSSIRGMLQSTYLSTQVQKIETLALKYPSLMQKYKPYLAVLIPERYQFIQTTRTSLSFPIHVSNLKQVQAYATAKRFSFVVDELNLWPKKSVNRYWSTTQEPPIGNKVVVTFATDDPKRLVMVKLKAINWLDEATS